MNPWLAIAGVGLSLGGLMAVGNHFRGTAEVRRKVVHAGMGLLCVTFPWIFAETWPVWILACAASLVLLLVRLVPSWKTAAGDSLHGVGRWSIGELWFAPAVALVFELADGRPGPFVAAVLVLAVADAAGALAGTRWGRSRYAIGCGWKSVEGSAAFFVAAVGCVAVALLLWETVSPLKVMWIALTVGLLATMAEGLSDRGSDNLVLPLWVFFLIDRFLGIAETPLALRLGGAVLMLALVTCCGRASTLDGAALLAAGLLGYGLVVLGGWGFLLPVEGVFVAHLLTTWHQRLGGVLRHGREPVFGVAVATLPWAAAKPWVGEVVGTLGCTLGAAAMLLMMHCGTRAYLRRDGIAPVSIMLKLCLLVILPGMIAAGWREVWWLVVLGVVAGIAASAAEAWLRKRWRSDERGLWLTRGALAWLASTAALWKVVS